MEQILHTGDTHIRSIVTLAWHTNEQGLTEWGSMYRFNSLPDEELLSALLADTCLKKLNVHEHYHCSNQSNGEDLLQQIFTSDNGIESLIEEICTHQHVLQEAESGFVFFVQLDQLYIGGEEVKGWHIFASSSAESLIQIRLKIKELGVVQGYNLNKLHFNLLLTKSSAGFKIFSTGHLPKRGLGDLLAHKLLVLELSPGEYIHTREIIKLCHDFSKELQPDKFEESTRKIDFLQHSARYFEDESKFDMEMFKKEALAEPELIDAFEAYKSRYEQKKQIEIPDKFEISPVAFQQSKKYIRSVIKLDKNFHIYIHSKPEFVERGFDESRQLKYYKLYYQEES